MNSESDFGDDALAEGQTLKMSPDQMQALLAAGGQGMTRELRGWHPPSVEALQKMLPQYEIAEFIARGGMGAVYKGVQRALDRTVAIKILPPDIVEDGEANYAQRFKQEARAMAKFKHPGIVTVYDAGEVELGKTRRQGDGEPGGSLLYFVMEFIEGTDVAHLVATHGQLPPEQAIRITTAVCDALAYAHARGVVHRDIKPSNIMMDADGQVKVADFGLARVTTHEQAGITKSSVAMGTPDFVAPEALIAGTLVDQRADIYAVGVMLYQMLTGHIPRGRFSPISAVVPKSDPKLDAIVDKAMQTDREKRYSSAVEMKADVESMTRSDRLQRPPPHAPAVANRRSLIFALAALLVIGFGGWSMLKRPPKPDASSPLDLLSLVEVKRDAIYGAWQKTPAGLSIARTSADTAGEGDPRVEFPFEVPVAYDYEMEFTPQDEGAGIKQIFSAGGRNGAWVMDFGEEAQPMMVLDRVSGARPGSSAETTVKRTHRLTPGTRYRSRIEVREGELAFFLNDEPLLRWKGDFSQLSVDSAKALRSASHLGVAATQRDVVFHKITVQVATGGHALTGAATTPHGPHWSRMPTEEEKKLAFTNTLGMKFVPVPGTEVLFCIHETRKADYAAYAAGVPGVDGRWNEIEAGPDHPVVNVSWKNAKAFCAWLSQKEGRTYRLPTDREWSHAVGIGDAEDEHATPESLITKLPDRYPWGSQWPPPQGTGNFSGEEAIGHKINATTQKIIPSYRDGFVATAPVGSFHANPLGIFDLSGNVWEWCENWMNAAEIDHVLRGAAWDESARSPLLSSMRIRRGEDHRFNNHGFRVVAETKKEAKAIRGPHWPHLPNEEEKKLAFTNTLGMKFVPVPGTEVLFCIHETRKADYAAYAAYAAAVPGVDATWRQPTFYRDTPVSPTPEHPVVWVSLEDAQGFCTWLTEKEGRKYRLPSDYEWSCAVGIAEREDREALPTARGAQFVPDFAWGTDWPPPKGAGNIGDETLKRVTGQEPVITGYDDGFATTAPVMSFPPNALGIHDLAGNVWEWCPDWFDSRHKHLVRRGSSYDNGHPAPQRAYVAACVRNPSPTDHRSEDGGFRIVAER